MGDNLRLGLALIVVAGIVLSACAGTEPAGIAESDVSNTGAATSGGNETTQPAGDSTPEPTDESNDDSSDGSDATTSNSAGGQLAESSRGAVFLDSVVIERAGASLTVRFTLSTTREDTVMWSYEMAESVSASELDMPTAMTIIDTANATEYGVLQPDNSGCVCSPLADLQAGNPIEYFATFDDPGVSDFELNIPTFPLIPVRDDVAQPAVAPAVIGLQPGGSNGNGLVLDAIAARRTGQWIAVEFQVSNPNTDVFAWSYALSADISASELDRPTGITLFDPTSQSVASPLATDESSCVCSKLTNIPAGGTATYFAMFAAPDGDTTTVSIPGFPQTSGVPVVAG